MSIPPPPPPRTPSPALAPLVSRQPWHNALLSNDGAPRQGPHKPCRRPLSARRSQRTGCRFQTSSRSPRRCCAGRAFPCRSVPPRVGPGNVLRGHTRTRPPRGPPHGGLEESTVWCITGRRRAESGMCIVLTSAGPAEPVDFSAKGAAIHQALTQRDPLGEVLFARGASPVAPGGRLQGALGQVPGCPVDEGDRGAPPHPQEPAQPAGGPAP